MLFCCLNLCSLTYLVLWLSEFAYFWLVQVSSVKLMALYLWSLVLVAALYRVLRPPSPRLRSVRGRTRLPMLEAHNDECDGMPATVWAGRRCSLVQWPANVLWTSRHSLYSTLCPMGNQCNSRRAEVTWSRGFRSSTSLAVAFRDRRALPDYQLCRLYHGRGPRLEGVPADQLPIFYHAVLMFERSV